MPDLLDGDDSSFRDTTTTSEATPLLRSAISSNPSTRSSSPPSDRGPNGRQVVSDLDVPNQQVSRARAVAIILSVYILIFLQGPAFLFLIFLSYLDVFMILLTIGQRVTCPE